MAHSMMSISTTPISSQNVSRETFFPLSDYVNLLLKWNSKINLIGPMTAPDVWSRHVDDSLQLLPLIPESATSLVDLGSGAGLPGMIIAIAKPDLNITLVEQDQRKAAFLNEARRSLKLANVTVEAANIMTVTKTFDVVSARALAPLSQLLAYAKPLLNDVGACLFPKGENHLAEVEEASRKWTFNHSFKTSKTNDNASIVIITNLAPR